MSSAALTAGRSTEPPGSTTNGRAPTSPRGRGWDWTGINLFDGGSLTAFRMRGKKGGVHYAPPGVSFEAGSPLEIAAHRRAVPGFHEGSTGKYRTDA